MGSNDDILGSEKFPDEAEGFQTELHRRIYHMKTLYDVSNDIFGSVEFETILRNFLLMTTGNFGVIEGFILTQDLPSKEITHFASVGFGDHDRTSLSEGGRRILLDLKNEEAVLDRHRSEALGVLPQIITSIVPFRVDEACSGLLGLGSKIVGEPYTEDDKQLLITLVNNLVVALRNARSFEHIKRLNLDLQEKNVQLEKALGGLQAAMKKVEILESIKANLCKFVPATVTKLIEKSPTASIPEARDQDVSVLFLDIEGYTKMSERLGNVKLNELIEKYFSVFMDAIYANNGDVNETAGDGLMVLFLSEDRTANALEAVRAALTIRQKATLINQEDNAFSEFLAINMGINSGRVLLGAAKFESFTGSRWTYTARGMVTNVAAKIAAFASDGAILLSGATADRIKDHFPIRPLGKYSLKNVSNDVELYALEEQKRAVGPLL